MQGQGEALDAPFRGWRKNELLTYFKKLGINYPKNIDAKILTQNAIEYFREKDEPIPRPPPKRTLRRRNRISQGSVVSRASNAKSLTRRVKNTGGTTVSESSKTIAKERGSEDGDIIGMLLDQVENDGRSSVNSQSYFSKPSTIKHSHKKKKPALPKSTNEAQDILPVVKIEERKATTQNRRKRISQDRNKHRYSGGINDFGEYDAELAQEDAAWFAFSLGKPDVLAAKDFAKRFHPVDYDSEKYFVCGSTGGRFCFPDSFCCDVFNERNESDFAKYGVGLSLYFKWLKFLFWLFFILSLVTFPQLFFNLSGAGSIESTDFQSLAFGSTIGNLLDDTLVIVSEDNSTGLFEPIGSAFPNSTITLPGFQCDGSPCEVNRETIQYTYIATDFIVVCIFLAAAIYLRYFTIAEHSLLQKSFRKIEQYTVKINFLPKEASEEGLRDFLEKEMEVRIQDINFSRDDSQLIELYQERGKYITKMWAIVGEARRLVEKHKKKVGNLSILNVDVYNEKVEVFVTKLNQRKIEIGLKYDEAYAHYIALDERRKRCRPGKTPISAFITFETAADFDVALETLSKRGLCRRGKKRRLSETLGQIPKYHDKNLRAVAAPPPNTIIWENLEYSTTQRCTRQLLTSLVTIILLSFTFTIAFLAQSFRVELSADSRNQTFAEECDNLEVLSLDCRCNFLPFTEAATAILDRGNECHEFWSGLAPVYIFTSFAALIISTVSMFLSVATRVLASVEKHSSVQSKELSIGSRLYVALFINVGLALLLANADMSVFGLNVLEGRYSDFESEWYANVGVQIFLTTLINSFAPHSLGISGFLLQKFKQVFLQPKVQAEMNKLYLGGEFAASYRYAQQLTAVSITMIYGGGLPVFYILAAVNFAIYYWVDKYLILRYYQTPPDFGDKLGKFASRVLLLLVPAHAAVALYMYTAPGLFLLSSPEFTSSTGAQFVENSFERITLSSSLPHLFLVCLGVVVFLIDTFLVVPSRIYNHQSARLEEDEDFDTVSKGLQNKKFASGLTSYNVLENRKYMNAFGISPIFARNHKGVSALFTNQEENRSTVPALPGEIRIQGDPYADHAELLR